MRRTASQLTPVFREWAAKSGTPWVVTFPRSGLEAPKRRFYRTEDAARRAVQDWRCGNVLSRLSNRDAEELLKCRALLPPHVTLRQVVRFFLEHRHTATVTTVAGVCAAYTEDIRIQGRSLAYQAEQRRVFVIVRRELGARTVFSLLTKVRLIAFIKVGKTHWTRYARHRAVSVLISKARELEAIKDDPLDGWVFEDAPPRSRPHFLTLPDVEAFLSYAAKHRPDCLTAFAFQLFAGIRTEELCRTVTATKRPLEWTDVKWGVRIDVGPEVSKTGYRRVIRFWPEALTNWCALSPKHTGTVCPRCYLSDVKSKLVRQMNAERKAQGLPLVPFRQNDFRRTYATHSVQLIGAEKTQVHLGHNEGSAMLKKHYEDYVEPEEAAAYFDSAPSALLPRYLPPANDSAARGRP